MKIEKILIPTDFSEAGQAAVARGMDLARESGAAVELVHVLRKPATTPMFPISGPAASSAEIGETGIGTPRWLAIEKAARAELESIINQQTPGVEASAVLEVANDVAATIIDVARESNASMIVMGTHGHRGAKRFLLGSVAEEVVGHAPCTVVTVGAAGSLEPKRPKKILGALDLEQGTDAVVAAVEDLCKLYGAEAHYIHAVPLVELGLYLDASAMSGFDPSIIVENAESQLQKRLETLGIEPTDGTRWVVAGQPTLEITRYAEDNAIDLIVVATHSRTGLPHVLLGSVADRVVRTAPCPVMTVLGQQRHAKRQTTAA